jgi:hypothetical protein
MGVQGVREARYISEELLRLEETESRIAASGVVTISVIS